ncbi:MAG: hypothetical protein A3B31_00060 [Candidatus Komeilibacteria bacterium RIFCSPLOWO2_01_FULL_53_11]|uniref:Solute-binding protein family 5 domain-containing protein n=1 Tax=Candidatus Komeilibacteria bacterium RIFCSPLOWO2_01_FULL_53_11 TaxID=1798552 RepID=A0A1G2BTQ8_9BACT|nr:MAG: hypothetical protein A3B31_00060 [Candidatus Komeilibacteria bacterium RIFCSPLOWO2_01_FULL_53_11]
MHEQLDAKILAHLNARKIPTPAQLAYLPRMLNVKEKRSLLAALLVFIIASALLGGRVWLRVTTAAPKSGGSYMEGLIGVPRFINPLLASSNDTDRDISSLVFAGLFRIDHTGGLVPDMADSISVSEDQKVYTIALKENLTWHDGEPISADDIVYTIHAIQDPALKSPLRITFTGIEIAPIDRKTIMFTLQRPFPSFLSALTVGILPEHIWYSIPTAQAHLAEYNIKPIGSGKYKFKSLTKDSTGVIRSMSLQRFDEFHGARPYIDELTFKFYSDFPTALEALQNKNVEGLSFLPISYQGALKDSKNIELKRLTIPQYNALFFNPEHNALLKDRVIRSALARAVDRDRIVREALGANGTAIMAPLIPGFDGDMTESNKLGYDPESAKTILDAAGWKLAEGASVRTKDETELAVRITTIDQDANIQAANIIRENWEAVALKASVDVISRDRIRKDIIEPRAYEILLFGQIITSGPDIYALWHSSQNLHPGNNLSVLANKDVDQTLETLRNTTDKAAQTELYQKFIDKIAEEAFGIFLYNPQYLYPISRSIHGTENLTRIAVPADRFASISDWYVKVSRNLK